MENLTPESIGLSLVAVKVLGPLGDLVGEKCRSLGEYCINNIQRILEKAWNHVSPENKDSPVPPRVISSVLNEGVFCEDDLAAEYYAGILGSSKTANIRDDRGVFYLDLVKSLSLFQLHSHYYIYLTIRNIFNEQNINPRFVKERNRLRLYIPLQTYSRSLDLNALNVDPKIIMGHSLHGLTSKDLLKAPIVSGEDDINTSIKRLYGVEMQLADGMVIMPTKLGVELFMWVNGFGNRLINHFLSLQYPDHAVSKGFSSEGVQDFGGYVYQTEAVRYGKA